jgi:acyl-CoA thioesterase I
MKYFLAILMLVSSPLAGAGKPKKTFKIVFIGDSLTEGYGVSNVNSYPYLIRNKFVAKNISVNVVNAGTSGATSASALSKMRWQLRSQVKPDLMVVALGANDGLRGINTKTTKSNIIKAIRYALAKKIQVILAGMLIPPNYGSNYTKEFAGMYPEIAKKLNIPLIPFLLEGVAGNKKLNLIDRIHPNEKGYVVIADNIYPIIEKQILSQISKGSK